MSKKEEIWKSTLYKALLAIGLVDKNKECILTIMVAQGGIRFAEKKTILK